MLLNNPTFTVVCVVLTILANTFAGLSAVASDASLSPGTRTTFIVLGVIGGAVAGTLSAFGFAPRKLSDGPGGVRGLLGFGLSGKDFAVTIAVQTFLQALRTPGARAKFRAVSLQVFRQLKLVFAGDPDFQ